MSFYTDASLVLIPSGIKDQKVYCAKPVDGSGDLTFTRSNDTATRVGSDGLIEKVRTNYLRYSQDFSQWTPFGGATRTTGVTDPNGGTTAATISNLSSGNFDQGLVLNSNPMTIGSEPIVGSIWLKGTGTMAIYLERSVSGTYFFYSQEITLTSTWTRYQVTGATAGSRGGFSFGVSNFVGSTATSVDIAFGQTEFGDVPTNYIATTSAAVSVGPVANLPRLDYSGGATCPSLLLEPQRTNLALYSEQFDNAYWTKTAGVTITANTTISPDGYTNADTIAFAGGGDSINLFVSSGLSVVSGTTYTISVFTKSTTQVIFYGGATGGSGTNVYNGSVDYGNGWYRQSVTRTWSASDTVSVQLVMSPLAAGSIIAYGFQAELGAYATSYIPTIAATTRGADSAYKTGIASLIGQSEGTLFVDFTLNALADYGTPISVNDGSTTNYIWLTIFANGNLRAELFNGSAQASISYSGAVAGGRYKMAFGYKANDFALYVNGALVGTDLTGTTFSGTTLSRVDTNLTNATVYSAASESISQSLLFTTRLTNAQLAELTTI
jgi:hypothetical protein